MENHYYSIKKFLALHFPQAQFEDDTNIFEQVFVNSLFAMQLVLFVENEFHISIENDELNIENFSSITNIMRLIDGKKPKNA